MAILIRRWLDLGSSLTVFFGSCIGAAAWAANMQYITIFFETSDNKSSPILHVFAMGAAAAHWQAALFVLRPIETVFVIVSMKSMTLRLRSVLAANGYRYNVLAENDSYMHSCRYLLLCLSVICIVVGFASNVVAAMLRLQLFYVSSDGVAAIHMNDTVTYAQILPKFSDRANVVSWSSSIQPFMEAFVLFLNVVAVISASNAVIYRTRLWHGVIGFDLIRRMKFLRVVLLFFALPRIAYAAFEATVRAFQKNDYACLAACDASCLSNFSLMRSWLEFTPEFHAFLVFVSSPLLWLWAILIIRGAQRPEVLAPWAPHHEGPWNQNSRDFTNSPIATDTLDRRRRGFSAIYAPSAAEFPSVHEASDDRRIQLLGPSRLAPQHSVNFSGRANRSITIAQLDSTTSAYFHSAEPASDTDRLSRCR
jgi:hypothetical protein